MMKASKDLVSGSFEVFLSQVNPFVLLGCKFKRFLLFITHVRVIFLSFTLDLLGFVLPVEEGRL